MTHTPYADAFRAAHAVLTRFEIQGGAVFTFATIYDHYDVGDLPLYDVMDWLVAADCVRRAPDYSDWSHDTMRYQAGPNGSALHALARMFDRGTATHYTKRHVTSYARSLRHKYYNDALAPYCGTDHGSTLHFALEDASKEPGYGFRDIERCFQDAAERLDAANRIASGVKWDAVYLREAVQNVLDGDYPHMSWVQIPGY